MVSDKYQVRTTGPIDNITRQPVKGRKRAGGIRFGEMERDSLLAHGASFCLQDRLMNCSDYSVTHVCRQCGSILSPVAIFTSSTANEADDNVNNLTGPRGRVQCKLCQSSRFIEIIALPYVFRYLANELMAMNIRLTIEVKS
jgi:DNA-directed RNA polymerase I subunit RPA2